MRWLAGLTLVASAADAVSWSLGHDMLHLLPALTGGCLVLGLAIIGRPKHREPAVAEQPVSAGGQQPSPAAEKLLPGNFLDALDRWPEATAFADSGGTVTWVNEAWNDRHGLPAGEAAGTDWLHLSPTPEAEARWQQLVEEATERGAATSVLERRGIGGSTWMSRTTLAVIRDRQEIRAWWMVASEISESEGAFRQHARKVGHDLNNLLSAIVGNVGLAIDTPGLPPDVESDLREAETASLRAAEVIKHLQALARGTP